MNKRLILLFVILLTLCVPAFANQYDDEEKYRRFLENEDKKEQQQRDAARQRADDAEQQAANRANNDGSGSLLCLGTVLGIPAYLIWKNISIDKN